VSTATHTIVFHALIIPCLLLSAALTVLLAVAVAAGSTGYVLGARSNSRQPVTAPPRPGTTKSPLSNTSTPIPTDSSLVDLTDSEGSIDSDSDAEDEAALIKEGKMGTIKAGMTEECKLVLVVNQELGMGKGKIAAQC
jgi:peptidyl-tRNA hydrolase, PTH2 family